MMEKATTPGWRPAIQRQASVKPASSQHGLEHLPGWISHEVQAALDAIVGNPSHLRRKRVTVLRVAAARASGASLDTVWAQHDCGSREAWEGRPARGKLGWRDEPEVQAALDVAMRRAEWYINVRLGRAEEDAFDTIIQATPAAAQQLARMATQGVMKVKRNDAMIDEAVNAPEVIKAINSVLDRASAQTATKQPTSVEHSLSPELMAALDRAYGEEVA